MTAQIIHVAFPRVREVPASNEMAALLRAMKRLDAAVVGEEEASRRAAERADVLERISAALADEFEEKRS